MRRVQVCFGAALSLFTLLACMVAPPAAAQGYPAKPVRMVIPWPPGGTTDILGRLLADRLSTALKQPVLVDNRGGSNGIIGADIVAKSAPDGYTIMFHSATSHATNPAVYRNLSYDTLRDFAPVTQIARVALVIVVHPSFPTKTVQDLIELAKLRKTEINFASFGVGSMSHLAGELLNMLAGIKMVHVPYKGGGPALVETLGGQVPVYFSSITPSLPHIQSGRLRALAVTGPERSKLIPDVPAVAETPDLAGYDATVTYAVWAPTRTPPEIVTRLHGEIVKVLQLPDFRNRLTQEGANDPIGNTPEQMANFIRSEIPKLAALVKAAGIEAQ